MRKSVILFCRLCLKNRIRRSCGRQTAGNPRFGERSSVSGAIHVEMRSSWRSPVKRKGITKLEVFVGICLVGILLALLLPAVNYPRAQSRRNQCASQINNFAKATIQYEMSHKQLPGYVNDFGAFDGISDPSMPDAVDRVYRPGDKKLGSWIIPILPSLDAQPTYEIWTQDKYPLLFVRNDRLEFTENAAPNLAIFQCPESPMLHSKLGRNSYIANCGMHALDASGLNVVLRRDADEVSSPVTISFEDAQKTANGVFNNQYHKATNADEFPAGPRVRLDDLKDGAGNTALCSENFQAVAWHQLATDPDPSARLLQPAIPGEEVPYPPLSKFTQGMVWHYEDLEGFAGAPHVATNRRRQINSTIGDEDIVLLKMTPENAPDLARPSSAHADGVNIGFADGSSRFIVESIDYRVYQALLTPDGSQSDVPMPSFIAPEEAL